MTTRDPSFAWVSYHPARKPTRFNAARIHLFLINAPVPVRL